MLNKLLPLAAIALLAAGCQTTETKQVPATDPRIDYQGRIDFDDTDAPKLVWQASRVEFDFEGNALAFLFSDLEGQVFFDLTIDGRTTVVEAKDGAVPAPLRIGKGRHSVVLAKRSEASAGTVRFEGVRIRQSAQVFPSEYRETTGKLLFFGDSITAGACNEDPGDDQWDDRATHNALNSYAALTARALNADHRNVSVSGMGVSVGYTPPSFPVIWNRYEPHAAAKPIDPADYQPEIVFLNLGENDDSYSKNQGDPFPEDYASRYIEMVHHMRAAYPDAYIVLLRGGMYGGARSERLREPWQRVVQTLEAGDPKIRHFVFDHWSSQHPRVEDHQAMADELVQWIRENSYFNLTTDL